MQPSILNLIDLGNYTVSLRRQTEAHVSPVTDSTVRSFIRGIEVRSFGMRNKILQSVAST